MNELEPESVLPCIVCGKQLAASMEGVREPYPGTVFSSHGNYGSTVFDPALGHTEYLSVNICDDCLTAAAAKQHVQLVEPLARPRQVLRRMFWSVDVTHERDYGLGRPGAAEERIAALTAIRMADRDGGCSRCGAPSEGETVCTCQ